MSKNNSSGSKQDAMAKTEVLGGVPAELETMRIGADVRDGDQGTTYTSVSRHGLQKAFALAHLLSESESVPHTQKRQFKAIANLIWWAHGEPATPPKGAGAILWETVSKLGRYQRTSQCGAVTTVRPKHKGIIEPWQ